MTDKMLLIVGGVVLLVYLAHCFISKMEKDNAKKHNIYRDIYDDYWL